MQILFLFFSLSLSLFPLLTRPSRARATSGRWKSTVQFFILKEGGTISRRFSRFAAKLSRRRVTHQNTRRTNKARVRVFSFCMYIYMCVCVCVYLYIHEEEIKLHCAAYLGATAVSSRDKRGRANGEKWGRRDIITQYEQTFFCRLPLRASHAGKKVSLPADCSC